MNKKITIPENIRKIGFCADIHGIYESLIKLIEVNPDIEHWFCAGDVVDMKQPIHNNQPAIRLVQRNNIPSVLGNHEMYIRKHLLSNFDDENQRCILEMPFSLEIKFSELNIAVYHSSAKKVDDYLPEDESDEKFTEAFIGTSSDIIVIGHTHNSFIKKLKDFTIVNPGSLGAPIDRPSYCIIDSDGEIKIEYIEE